MSEVSQRNLKNTSKDINQKILKGFHPNKSRVSADTLAEFLRAPITGDLNEVSG